MNSLICACVVTYNPEIPQLKLNIESLISQVNRLIVVDNHSKNIDEVSKLCSNYQNTEVISNSDNFGIAKALNIGLEYAINNGYPWLLTMDQDSLCDTNLILQYKKYLDMPNIAIISPYILNNNKVSFEEYKSMNLPDFEYISSYGKCITSASLINVEIASKLKGFNDDLFIDCVDFDFNMKVLINGYKILKVNTTYMFQKMGDGLEVGIFSFLYSITKLSVFRKVKVIAEYSNLRIYYISRNSKWFRKHYNYNKGNCSTINTFIVFTLYILFYPLKRNRLDMLKAMFCGSKDAKNNILGKKILS